MIKGLLVIAATTVVFSFMAVTTVQAQGITNDNRTAACEGLPSGSCDDTDNDFEEIWIRILDVLLFVVGAVAVLMLIIGGLRYVISAGDQQAVTNAKNTILYAIVGIIVTFLAYAAVRFVVAQLQGEAL